MIGMNSVSKICIVSIFTKITCPTGGTSRVTFEIPGRLLNNTIIISYSVPNMVSKNFTVQTGFRIILAVTVPKSSLYRMGYIVILNRLAGIQKVALLVPPMVPNGMVQVPQRLPCSSPSWFLIPGGVSNTYWIA